MTRSTAATHSHLKGTHPTMTTAASFDNHYDHQSRTGTVTFTLTREQHDALNYYDRPALRLDKPAVDGSIVIIETDDDKAITVATIKPDGQTIEARLIGLGAGYEYVTYDDEGELIKVEIKDTEDHGLITTRVLDVLDEV